LQLVPTIKKEERAEVVAQVVESLPSMCEILSSNSSITKRRRGKRRKGILA
jgi:hypothetical protein